MYETCSPGAGSLERSMSRYPCLSEPMSLPQKGLGLLSTATARIYKILVGVEASQSQNQKSDVHRRGSHALTDDPFHRGPGHGPGLVTAPRTVSGESNTSVAAFDCNPERQKAH
jgi:hypothetical protein